MRGSEHSLPLCHVGGTKKNASQILQTQVIIHNTAFRAVPWRKRSRHFDVQRVSECGRSQHPLTGAPLYTIQSVSSDLPAGPVYHRVLRDATTNGRSMSSTPKEVLIHFGFYAHDWSPSDTLLNRFDPSSTNSYFVGNRGRR